MTYLLVLALAAAIHGQTAAASDTRPAAEQKSRAETLRFNVNWPSGLSLGEGELASSRTPDGWNFSIRVEAAIPAFTVAESAESRATPDLCSVDLRKDATRGSRKISETTKFDQSSLSATRQTAGGGKSEIRINPCAKDALAFLQFLRNELIAGRLPQPQQVYYGAAYQTRVQYMGGVRVNSGGEAVEADKLTLHVRGPASEFSVDLFFARDASRTPVQAQIPVAVGKFTVEFLR